MRAGFRRAAYWLLRPLWRLVLRVLPTEDPWERVNYRIPVKRFGTGAKHDFHWYFQGDSFVRTTSIDDVVAWLLECEYVRDPELFHEPDFWQHPRTFERLRRGDCEDHAIWAWRKLVELGYDADLVSGRCLPWDPRSADTQRAHVWVVFRQDGNSYLLDAASKDRARVVRSLEEAAPEYRPEYGVDRHRTRFAFSGVLLTMREREFGIQPERRLPQTA